MRALALAVLVAALSCDAAPAPAQLVDLSTSLDALNTDFNAHAKEPRFIALVSPTCGECLSGARAVHAAIPRQTLYTSIVWLPMLDGDGSDSAHDAAKMFTGVAEYWDGAKRVAAAITPTLGPTDWTAWDVYLFYAPGRTWTDAPPTPDRFVVQDNGVILASKGALPAAADQQALPPRFRDVAEVVGPPAQLEKLLGRVASRYAR